MRKIFLLTLLLIPSISFADDAANRPGWVDGNTKQYPDARYITAVGNGSTREAAIQSAKNNLASSLQQKVQSETNTQSKSDLKQDTNAGASGEDSSSTQKSLQISTNVEVRGLEMKEFWQDPVSKDQYALAVVDKLKVRTSYMMDLNRKKDRLLAAYESFKKNPNQKKGREVLDLAQEYADLEKEAATMGAVASVSAPVSSGELEKLRAQLDDLKAKKPIALLFTAESDSASQQASDLQEMVAGCLADKGYAIATGKDSAASLTASLRVKEKHMKVEGFVSEDFTLKVSLKGPTHTDRKMITRNGTGRDLDQAFDNSKQFLTDSVCSMITDSI
jgi:hypothetical protein